MYLFGYRFIPFLGKDSLLLSEWRERRAYVELVDYDIRTDPWHALVAPSKDVPIFL